MATGPALLAMAGLIAAGKVTPQEADALAARLEFLAPDPPTPSHTWAVIERELAKMRGEDGIENALPGDPRLSWRAWDLLIAGTVLVGVAIAVLVILISR